MSAVIDILAATCSQVTSTQPCSHSRGCFNFSTLDDFTPVMWLREWKHEQVWAFLIHVFPKIFRVDRFCWMIYSSETYLEKRIELSLTWFTLLMSLPHWCYYKTIQWHSPYWWFALKFPEYWGKSININTWTLIIINVDVGLHYIITHINKTKNKNQEKISSTGNFIWNQKLHTQCRLKQQKQCEGSQCCWW